MKFLEKGKFFGISKKTSQFRGLTVRETEYPAPVAVPWHYHENPHFTFFMSGHVLETSKKNAFHCTPGTLVFHNCQEPHYNNKHSPTMHYFHVEIENKWFAQHGVSLTEYEGHTFFDNIKFRGLFNHIYKEFRTNDSVSPLAIEGLLLQCFCQIKRFEETGNNETPYWIKSIQEFMQDNCAEPISLELLSKQCGRSAVYLSQVFPKYFKSTFGEYIRCLRIEKAVSLLSQKDISLSSIAYQTGFSDQSHFSRCFKQVHGLTPREYRKIVFQH